ncbi:hypothetical protein STEG23_033614, partial [Scotinomys teguina]
DFLIMSKASKLFSMHYILTHSSGLFKTNLSRNHGIWFLDDDATARQMSKENRLSYPCSSITLLTNFPKGSCKLLVKLKSGCAPETVLSLSSPGNCALYVALLTFLVEPDLFLRLVYNEKQQVGQKELQNTQLEEEKGTRKFNVGAMVYAKRDKEKQNNGKDALRLDQYQSHAGCGMVEYHKTTSKQNIQGFFIEEYFHIAFTESMFLTESIA